LFPDYVGADAGFPVLNSSHHRREFEDVMCGAEHGPLGSRIFFSPEKKLPESTSLFDQSKDGLDNLFPQSIAAAPSSLPQPRSHPSNPFTFGPICGRIQLPMFLTSGRYIAANPSP
jgi:hypothetical protein